jgi:hypothetical protein
MAKTYISFRSSAAGLTRHQARRPVGLAKASLWKSVELKSLSEQSGRLFIWYVSCHPFGYKKGCRDVFCRRLQKVCRLDNKSFLILIAVVWAIIVICLLLDKIFSLGWGYEWIHLLYLFLMGVGFAALYLFSKLIAYVTRKIR